MSSYMNQVVSAMQTQMQAAMAQVMAKHITIYHCESPGLRVLTDAFR